MAGDGDGIGISLRDSPKPRPDLHLVILRSGHGIGIIPFATVEGPRRHGETER